MTRTYGPICGVLIAEGSASTPRRCYAKGLSRYDGRCRQHADEGALELQKARLGPRCGFVGTDNGRACHNYVLEPGGRCGKHSHEALAIRTALRRANLEERISAASAQRRQLDRRITELRAELADLTAHDHQEAAE